MSVDPVRRERQFPAVIKTRAPAALSVVVSEAARQREITASEYIRGAVNDRLLRDGFDFRELVGGS